MSYILGSLGAKPDPLAAIAQQFSSVLGDTAKQAVKANLTRFQAYNLFRFNRPDIRSSSDKQLTTLMARDRKGDIVKATPHFKAWDAAVRGALLVMNLGKAPTNKQINDMSFDLFKQAYDSLIPPDDKGNAGAAGVGETDYTPWIIGGVAVVAVGALVLRGQSMGPKRK